MTRNDTWLPAMAPDITLHQLIDTHGVLRTLTALLRVLATRRRIRVDLDALPAHLRRDIGLGEAPAEIPRGPHHPWL